MASDGEKAVFCAQVSITDVAGFSLVTDVASWLHKHRILLSQEKQLAARIGVGLASLVPMIFISVPHTGHVIGARFV